MNSLLHYKSLCELQLFTHIAILKSIAWTSGLMYKKLKFSHYLNFRKSNYNH